MNTDLQRQKEEGGGGGLGKYRWRYDVKIIMTLTETSYQLMYACCVSVFARLYTGLQYV